MRRLALLAAGALLLGGCGSSNSHSIDASSARELVLRQGDLPAGFAGIGSGRESPFAAADRNRADPGRFGRKGGWFADFRRPGGAATRGPLVIHSGVDVFGDAGGAKKEFATYEDGFRKADGSVDAPALGEEATALSQITAGVPGAQVFTIVWRRDNASAVVVVTGLRGKLALNEALALARKQDRRLVSAAGGT